MKKLLAAIVVLIVVALYFTATHDRSMEVDPTVESETTRDPTIYATDGTEEALNEVRRFSDDPEFAAISKQADLLMNPRNADRYEIQNFGAQFSGWLNLMKKGDLKAAKAIWDANIACSQRGFAPFSPRSYEDMRSEIMAQASNTGNPPSKMRLMQIAALYSRCGNVSKEQRQAAIEAIGMLAESGDWAAKRDYISLGRPDVSDRSLNEGNRQLYEYKKQATKYMDEEIAAGNIDAMMLRSVLHGGSDFTQAPSIYEADPVQSLGYSLAAINVLKSRLSHTPESMATERQRLQELISQHENDAAVYSVTSSGNAGGLTQEQIRMANELAQEVAGRCCK
ncbi:hypothetical protein C7S18_20280 [Ahniella affigens]|uniref:Uncharacterized protein n=1 Tax=Ahniella affigens TaxID=2021234 RepID=A0A2P1PX04_9GAMM|nr:hypothetical protein [Ahniella affigens]AVP99365.1 hypothetical protein C7S18_20280 [Ahniella affigens]